MKVRVKAEFKDKHTGKVYKIGDELEMSIQRINEVITVGNLIELIEQSEQVNGQEENADAGEQAAEETPKQTGRRKRTK